MENPKYEPTASDVARLREAFTYHAPHGDQVERYQRLREGGGGLAMLVLQNAPQSRERSLALTKIEEACFWANAAIARHEPAPAADRNVSG